MVRSGTLPVLRCDTMDGAYFIPLFNLNAMQGSAMRAADINIPRMPDLFVKKKIHDIIAPAAVKLFVDQRIVDR